MLRPLLILNSIACLWLAGTSRAYAEDGLSLSGGFRLRYEAIEGQARVGFNKNDTLINTRTNIFAGYTAGNVRFGLEIYDSRIYGDDDGTPVTTNEVNALEPVQAYIAADIVEPFGKGSEMTLTAGRMMLNLGSRRLVAADDYRNTTNSYTGVRADIGAPGKVHATLIYTLPNLRLPDDPDGLRDAEFRLDKETFDYVLWGGIVSKAGLFGNTMAELTYFHLDEEDGPARPTRDRLLHTMGGRLIAEPQAGRFDYEIEAYYQTGDISASLTATAARLPVSATFVHADAGYSFETPWKPRLSFEFDRASGDRPGGKFTRFDTLFGMRRADFAPSGLYATTGRANIMTPGVRLEATPNKRVDWFAGYHALWLAADEDSFSTSGVRDATGGSGDFAGHQMEARVRYWLVPSRLRFEFDGLLLAKGHFLRDAPNAPPGRWTSYTSFNLTASF